MAKNNQLLIVVIPTYNERENIQALVTEITALGPAFHALVVDDNSPDGTGEAVRQMGASEPRVHLLSRPRKQGYGPAVLDGFRRAIEMRADRIFTMDADFSHNPRDLREINRMLDTREVAIGSRYCGGIRILNWSFARLMLSQAANAYARAVLRLKYADCTSGYRGYRREVLENLLGEPLTSSGYAFLVELLYTADRKGYRIGEAPIIYTERRCGQSKMSRASMVEAAYRPWLLLFRELTIRFNRLIRK